MRTRSVKALPIYSIKWLLCYKLIPISFSLLFILQILLHQNLLFFWHDSKMKIKNRFHQFLHMIQSLFRNHQRVHVSILQEHILCELFPGLNVSKTLIEFRFFLGVLLISFELLVPGLKPSGLILVWTSSQYVEMFKVNSSSIIFFEKGNFSFWVAGQGCFVLPMLPGNLFSFSYCDIAFSFRNKKLGYSYIKNFMLYSSSMSRTSINL